MNKLSVIAKSTAIAISMIGIAHAELKNWTGLYAGVEAGLSFNHAQLRSQQLGFTNINETYNTHSNFLTFTPGIQIGYLHQFSNSFVSGIEANATINTNQADTLTSSSNLNPNVYDRLTFRNQMQASMKGRLGHTLNWNQTILLPYLTTGASFANVGLTYKNEAGNYYSNHHMQIGWLIGAGIEWAFMPHWSLRTEYNYIDYGDAINLKIPSVYGLLDPNGGAHINLSSNNIVVALNYWI